jgi:plasmid stabilization system protein ParE
VTTGLTLRPEAEHDLKDAAHWYERQREGLGHRFLDEALDAFGRIAEQPKLFPVVHRSVRRALIRKFPFAIFYRVETDAIVVLAILHGSRDPVRWKERT